MRLDVTVDDVDALDAEAVVVTAPSDDYDEMVALLCVLERPSAVPSPGGLQLSDDPRLSFVGDNHQKGISAGARADRPREARMRRRRSTMRRVSSATATIVESRELRWRHGRAAHDLRAQAASVTDAAASRSSRAIGTAARRAGSKAPRCLDGQRQTRCSLAYSASSFVDAGDALDDVVVAHGERQPRVARRAERLAGHDGHLGLVEQQLGQLGGRSAACARGSCDRARPRTTGSSRTPLAARSQ